MLWLYASEKDFEEEARLAKTKIGKAATRVEGLRARVLKMHIKLADIQRKVKI